MNQSQKQNTNPQAKNSRFSKIFFCHALKLFSQGSKEDLDINDVPKVLPEHESRKISDQLEKQWEKQKQNGNLSLVYLILRCYGLPYFLLGLIQLFNDALLGITIQSYVLEKLVSYFVQEQTELSKNDAYFYATTLISVYWIRILIGSNYALAIAEFGIRVRTAFCSLIYRKVLKLGPNHTDEISSGKILTLITNDVTALELFINVGNEIWISIVKIIVASVILYLKIGVASLTGIACFLFSMPLQIYIGKKITRFKMEMNKKTDERLQITQEMVSSIRLVRMYTWEKIFSRKLNHFRREEINSAYKMFILKLVAAVIGTVNAQIALYTMFITFLWLGNTITSELVYFIFVIFLNMSLTVSVLFPISLSQAAEAFSAIKRISQMVKQIETGTEEQESTKTNTKIKFTNVAVLVKGQEVLHDINLELSKGLVIITGPVGCGKSTLLKTILKEYKVEKGVLEVEGDISYASQEPWLFPASIKQNILFGEQYEESRYAKIIKMCALSYDFQFNGDGTIVEDAGANLSKGQQSRINLARALYKQSDIYLLDDCLASLDVNVTASLFNHLRDFSKENLVILASHNTKHLQRADVGVILKNGRIKFVMEASTGDNDSQNIESEEEDSDEHQKLLPETKVYHEDKKSGKVDFTVYQNYFRFGGTFVVASVFIMHVLFQMRNNYTDKFISDWAILEESASRNGTDIKSQREHMVYIFSYLMIFMIVASVGRVLSIAIMAKAVSTNLYKKMTESILDASLSFFDTNFVGNIMNRFSKDLSTVDEYIPFTLHHVLTLLLSVAGLVGLIAMVNKIFLIPLTIFLAISIIVRTYCIRTTRSLKRLEAAVRSPLVGHIKASLEGLTTIRAAKAESTLKDEFDLHQDLYNSVSYALQATMKGLIFIVNTFSALFNAIIVARFLIFDNDTPSGYVGLALSQAYIISMTLNGVIHRWTELENQMTSTERVLEYIEVKKENKQGLVLENWPEQGEIRFENVFLKYHNSHNILQDIDFVVKPGEKIGIVGRTAAGKSSLVSTLFRLYEPEGKITIDGVDIRTLSVEFLRSKISIITQTPVLFTGTIRNNIDPFEKSTDEEIWKTLHDTNLKQVVSDLDAQVVAGGSFTLGQKQLILLARAVVQKNQILVLDEATANVDAETEEVIRKFVKVNFASCTVLSIAHRLESVLDCDKILVLDQGSVIEYDRPEILLQNRNSVFREMVNRAGFLASEKV